MSIFDEFRQTGELQEPQQLSLSPAEAFGAIVLLAIAADGHFSTEERNLLHTTLGRMRLFRSYSGDVMARMFENLSKILKRDGAEILFGAAMVALPYDLYETVFAIATDLVLADGEVAPEEEQLLNSLCKALDLPEERVRTTIAVMLIKNKA